MTQIPPGWYPDPDPAQPEPRGQRYWNGQSWTAHVQPASGQPGYGQAPPEQGEPAQAPYGQAGPGQPQQPGPAQQPYGYAPMAPYGGGVQIARATTPDGQELAGWWSRVVAYLLDGIIVGLATVLVAFPWMTRIGDAYGDFISQAMDAAESGSSQVPDQGQLMSDIAGPLLIVSLIGLVISFAYHASFLRWKAATPGKLALGLRVRLRETPGPLAWGTIVKRWLGQFGYAILSIVPILGSIVSLYPLIDGLWPLWDSRKQALHDKIAATNVVRVRKTS